MQFPQQHCRKRKYLPLGTKNYNSYFDGAVLKCRYSFCRSCFTLASVKHKSMYCTWRKSPSGKDKNCASSLDKTQKG